MTLFAVDSPVKTYPMQEKKQELPEEGAPYTGKCLELLASVCLDMQFLRMSQHSLLETVDAGLHNFSMIWPRSGTMQNGTVYRLQNLARTITEIGSGLLPTPTLDTSPRKKRYSQGGMPLSLALRMLPTPTCSDAKGSPKSRTILNNKSNLCEVLRLSEDDPIYPHPCFVEQMMGFPEGWTELDDKEMR